MINKIHYSEYDRLKKYIINKAKIPSVNLKFLGVLKNYYLYEDKKSLEIIDYLIENKIFIENKIKNVENFKEDFKLMDSHDFHYVFFDFIVHNNKLYDYNFELDEEIYIYVKHFVENRFNYYLNEDEQFIISELNGYFENSEKILFLKRKIINYWKPFKNTIEFLIYMDSEEDWKQHFLEEFSYKHDIPLFYLTSKFIEEADKRFSEHFDTFKLWVKFYRKRNLIEFCKKKIIELENLLDENKLKPTYIDLVFSKDSEKLFFYIVEKYTKDKNTAFFSYLYFFLRDVVKVLKTTGNDNKDYRYFITDLYKISFSRIQVTGSRNQFKKHEMVDLFNKYTHEYYTHLKIEDNLSENE